MLRWLKWFFLCPFKWTVINNPATLRKYNGDPPLREVFRIRHPAFWVLYWQVAAIAWRIHPETFRRRWLPWMTWCLGGFLEVLWTGDMPGWWKRAQ